MKRLISALVCAASLMAVWPAFAQTVVGQVVTVADGARLERGGKPFRLAPEVSILSGDAIRTNGSGTVQLLFRDKTRIVIGPNSEFIATDIRMSRNGRASRFAVNTVGGTFRILSGNSAKRAYAFTTPTTTMGVRGTTFDFAIDPRTNTSLVTFSGEVQLCGAGRRCFAISGSCATIRASRNGVDPNPLEANNKVALLRQQFPFTQSQGALGRDFRTSLLGCDPDDDDDPRVRPAKVTRVPTPPPGQVVTLPQQAEAGDDADPSGGNPLSGL